MQEASKKKKTSILSTCFNVWKNNDKNNSNIIIVEIGEGDKEPQISNYKTVTELKVQHGK